MSKVFVLSGVRHGLSMVAGGLAVKYGVDQEAFDAILSGLVAAISVGWSILDKRQSNAK